MRALAVALVGVARAGADGGQGCGRVDDAGVGRGAGWWRRGAGRAGGRVQHLVQSGHCCQQPGTLVGRWSIRAYGIWYSVAYRAVLACLIIF